MVADPFPESRMCPLAEPQGTPADKGTKAQPRRHTGKAKKRKAEEIQTPGAELGPSTSGRPVPQRGASSARHEIDELFAAKPPKVSAPAVLGACREARPSVCVALRCDLCLRRRRLHRSRAQRRHRHSAAQGRARPWAARTTSSALGLPRPGVLLRAPCLPAPGVTDLQAPGLRWPSR